ncbi:MAG: hypothetical protein U1E35_05645 [Rhodospirillales bacterium]
MPPIDEASGLKLGFLNFARMKPQRLAFAKIFFRGSSWQSL